MDWLEDQRTPLYLRLDESRIPTEGIVLDSRTRRSKGWAMARRLEAGEPSLVY